jgi:deoxyribose-phosphate aldolase
MQHQEAARIALACLDLTSLNDADTEADVAKLCARAGSAHGPVAAVCVWPRFAAFARDRLPPSIRVAAVANFPDGSDDRVRAVRETKAIVSAGADEVDLVLPVTRMLRGDGPACAGLLQDVREACAGLTLKVILETGVLHDAATIRAASGLALAAGADFLKTSTGRTPVGATPAAAAVMLDAIAADPRSRDRAGFKAAGGVRTVADAANYIALVADRLGRAALAPGRFRIGASALLDDIEAVLGHGTAPGNDGAY